MAPINRAPWTALVDDSGQNLDGSIWNKAAIKTVLLDPIDVAGASPVYPSAVQLTPSGVNVDYNPPGAAAAVTWYLAAAAGTYLTGIVAAPVGTMHLLVNAASNPIILSNQHGASAAANRITCPGYADFSLGTWASIWIVYSIYGSWLALKA